MADVFISYAREDREQASRLAQALSQLGWSVWWDRKIVTGQAFDQVIERELEASKSVLVLWSRHSISSEWVKNEAAAAAELGLLVPATLEDIKLPLEFRHRQTANLSDWSGKASHAGFQALCDGLATLIGSTPERREAPQKKKIPRWTFAALGALAILAGLSIYWKGLRQISPDASTKATSGGLTDLAAGTYSGAVIAALKGGPRNDVLVTVRKLDRTRVRVSSDDDRLGAFDVILIRPVDNQILGVPVDPVFHLYLDRSPPMLELSVHSEISFAGRKQ